MNHREKRLQLYLAVLLLLRFIPVFEFLSGHHSNYSFAFTTIGLYLFTALTIKHVWTHRNYFHVCLPKLEQVAFYGIVLGVCFLALNACLVWLAHGTRPIFPTKSNFVVFILHGFAQFAVAAAVEEPLFRGFLWGYLKSFRQREGVILLVQALLFFLAHSYYARPGMYIYWVNTFIMGIGFGFSAWKTRSIVPAMVMHSIVNCSSLLFVT